METKFQFYSENPSCYLNSFNKNSFGSYTVISAKTWWIKPIANGWTKNQKATKLILALRDKILEILSNYHILNDSKKIGQSELVLFSKQKTWVFLFWP